MTVRQFLNYYFLKRNWSSSNADYVRNFSKAVEFTKKLRLDLPGFSQDESLSFSKDERDALCDQILDEFYAVRGYKLEDMAFNCWLRSKDLQQHLLERHNLPSTITSGNVFAGNRQLFYESTRSIKYRLADGSPQSPPQFHTWLTLPNFSVIDITFAPSIWFETRFAGQGRPSSEYQKMSWYNHWEIPKEQLFYQPIFLGYDFFNKVSIIPKVIPFRRDK